MSLNKKVISKIADDVENDFRSWFGPNGMCWCQKKKQYVHPDTCSLSECPECATLRSDYTRQIRYLHLHDDYKSYN